MVAVRNGGLKAIKQHAQMHKWSVSRMLHTNDNKKQVGR